MLPGMRGYIDPERLNSISTEMTMMSTEMADYSDEYNTSYDYPEDSGICNKDSINNFAKTFMPAFYVLLLLFSLLGNGLVLCVLVKYEYLRSITNIFILNLAVSDLLSAFCLPFWTMHHLTGWIFGDIMCKVVCAMFYTGFYSGIMFLTLMTFDRYLAVVHAVSALRSRKVRYAAITSVIVWGSSILATLPHAIFSTLTEESTCDYIYPKETALPWKLLRYFLQNVLFFVIPFAIIVYCYLRIIQTLIKCRTMQKYRTVKLIFIIVVVFFLCWAPYNVVIFLTALKDLRIFKTCEVINQIEYADFFTLNIAYFHCCLNPLFYAFIGAKFRGHLINLTHKCFPRVGNYKQQTPVIKAHNMDYSDGSTGNDITNNW
ncbi:C-C chemokine receptor type 8-like [Callorhinchus milii]|uniref:C-C chemokine receptor type 8-like n=1 Tax=Callorhinchus milii TaxID=7868 RepID=UPI0004572112|nr:C-C chemokine receptor type 8-like [Callorhinchus milii]|eukprot:gi/632965695/ref/XP_007899019.1/ PREDICTED: C-C chemokine receptor type 8-like [Callorhinchus milii]